MGTDPIVIPQDLPTTKKAAQDLYDQLSDANPIAQADIDTIAAAMDALNQILTQLNQEDILSRTGAMQAAAAEIKDPLKRLSDLKAQLAAVATRVQTLGTVASAVDAVLGGCGKVFKL